MNFIAQLAEYVQAQPDYQQAQPAFVSIYRHTRNYGGSEEGGWWYSRHELVGSKPFQSVAEAEAWLEVAKAEVARLNRAEAPSRARAMASLPDNDLESLPDAGEGYIPTSWNDGGELYITVEDKKGEHDNSHEPAPHYE